MVKMGKNEKSKNSKYWTKLKIRKIGKIENWTKLKIGIIGIIENWTK